MTWEAAMKINSNKDIKGLIEKMDIGVHKDSKKDTGVTHTSKRLVFMIGKIFSTFILIFSLLVSSVSYGAIEEDRGIVSADIDNIYVGRSTGTLMQSNLQFSDVEDDYWGKEAISRMGALDITKGYVVGGVRQFRPRVEMSKEEAIAFIMRAIGLEEEAKLAAENLNQIPGEGAVNLWSKGYLSLASQIGLITPAELGDALVVDQTALDPEFNFIRTSPVSREEVSKWLVQAINNQNPDLIEPLYRQQNIFAFNDFEEMDPLLIPYIEAVVENKIMVGDGASFNPKSNLLRGEMMQIMENMNTILYDTMNLVEKSGYVGHIEVDVGGDGNRNLIKHQVYVRNAEGSVDLLVQEREKDLLNNEEVRDAVVYRNNDIQSLVDLKEADTIHYIVDEQNDEIIYVEVVTSPYKYTVKGALEPLNDIEDGMITLVNGYGNKLTYTLADTLYDLNSNRIVIDEKYIPFDKAPITNQVSLTVKNQLVIQIDFGGELVTTDEISGIVIEHNRDFNYIRISDWNGNEQIKRYNEASVEVEKEDYYDNEDQVGYLDQLFPYYGFDEDDADINDIEAGDIVHLKLDPANSGNIIAISGKTNYTVKYGEVLTAVDHGDDGFTYTIKMEDNSIYSYEADDSVAVIKASKTLGLTDVKSGDIVRILVNQVVIGPGSVSEIIKEINIDPNGNVAGNIYKGMLGTINTSQETIALNNSYELIQTGWKNYQSTRTLDISDDQVEFYYQGDRITLSYADKYLRSQDMKVYAATEDYFGTEKVTKVSFRNGRDSVLPYSNVTLTNGFNQMETQYYDDTIGIDEGTIVIKNGRFVSASNIIAPDYTQVVLNGSDLAAVITVKPEPNNDAISVMRGRIAQINEYEDFTVQSHAVLSGMEWIYSPIERTYQIDYKTIIKDTEEVLGIDDFIGYSDASKVDQVYTIIANGVNATHILFGPYVKEGVIGEVTEVDLADSKISMKDTIVYDKNTKQWNELSRPNSFSQAEVFNESVIIKNNEVIDLDQLEIGDKLRIMTDIDLAEALKLEDTREFSAYILFVEN